MSRDSLDLLPIAITLYLLSKIDRVETKNTETKVDFIGALLCAIGLGGPVFALIEVSRYGWANPIIYLSLVIGLIIFVGFVLYERQTKEPMLAFELFARRNFSVGNIATLAVYAGLSASTFLIVVYLQQVNGYSALAAGLTLLPVTVIMFIVSPRTGALAGIYGPRLFMGVGPIIAGLGFLLMLRMGQVSHYWTELFPAVIVFGVGLSLTVAPLTAAILGDVPADKAGIASAINNAVARVAGLIAIAAVGAIVASQFSQSLTSNRKLDFVSQTSLAKAKQAPLEITPPKPYASNKDFNLALRQASVSAFHSGIATVSILVVSGGVVSLIGIKNPIRKA